MAFAPSLEKYPSGGPISDIDGKPCPWPYDPLFLVGAPLGQYHCPACGSMIIAGLPHLDYSEMCKNCGGRIQWVECPTGGWWSHEVHPEDDHDANPEQDGPL